MYRPIAAFILLCLLSVSPLAAQNLVRNNDFEAYTLSPGALLLEETVHNWYAYFTTPDYYNTAEMGAAAVLDNCGTLPHSGNGMVGGYQLGYFPGMPAYNREYIQGELTEPLKANTLYYAEVYVMPMLDAPVINFGIKNIGILVSSQHYKYIDSLDKMMIDSIPTIEYNEGVINDMDNWTKVSGCFIAKGGETKIIIGNFRRDEQTDTLQLPGAHGEESFHYKSSYYLFDDVLVKEMPAAYIVPEDIVICRDSMATLSAEPNDAGNYAWSTGSAAQSIQVNKSGTYTVQIKTKEGCVQEASAKVVAKHCGPDCAALFVPNAFSPNNDGLNDYYLPMNPEDINGLTLSIYNRWGERVFYSVKTDSKWDGIFKQKTCEAGTYFYYIEYLDCKNEAHIKKGDLVLLR